MFSNMQKVLIGIGAVLIVIGMLWGIFWPWLIRLPLGRLPGDIIVNRPGFKLYFPIATMVIISIVLSFILWLLRR